MADELTIVSIEVTQIRDGVESFDTGDIPKIADLKVTVRNDSSSKTMHVSILLGGFEYDDAAQRLNIIFREPDPAVTYRSSPFTPPIQDAVQPGEIKVFDFTIPLMARVITSFSEGPLGVKLIDASSVKEVVATFTYGTAPLRRPTEGSQASQAYLRYATRTGIVARQGLKRYSGERTEE